MSLKIYYLDDEPELLEIFVDMFASPQSEITVFTDPKKAVDAIKLNPPDLLFLDYRLPNTTGLTIAKQLDPAIRKFLITGDMSISEESCFDEILEKPMKTATIARIIAGAALKKRIA